MRVSSHGPPSSGICRCRSKEKAFPSLYEYEGKPLFYESFCLRQKNQQFFVKGAYIPRTAVLAGVLCAESIMLGLE
jgi:hypothetical protein